MVGINWINSMWDSKYRTKRTLSLQNSQTMRNQFACKFWWLTTAEIREGWFYCCFEPNPEVLKYSLWHALSSVTRFLTVFVVHKNMWMPTGMAELLLHETLLECSRGHYSGYQIHRPTYLQLPTQLPLDFDIVGCMIKRESSCNKFPNISITFVRFVRFVSLTMELDYQHDLRLNLQMEISSYSSSTQWHCITW